MNTQGSSNDALYKNSNTISQSIYSKIEQIQQKTKEGQVKQK